MLIEEASHDLHAGRIVTFPVRATVSGPAPMNSPQPGGEPANACGGGIETLLDGGGSALDQRRKRLPWLNTGSQNGHGLAVRSAPPLDSSGIAPMLCMMLYPDPTNAGSDWIKPCTISQCLFPGYHPSSPSWSGKP